MKETDVLKGIFAGIIGGIAATYAKTVWEDNFPVRHKTTDSPPVKLAEKINENLGNKALTKKDKKQAESNIHWAFGTGTGALYGALVEENKGVAMGYGIPFGTAFWVATHGSTIPAMDLEPFPHEVKPRKFAWNEFAGHLVYGLTLEIVRRGVRKYMD